MYSKQFTIKILNKMTFLKLEFLEFGIPAMLHLFASGRNESRQQTPIHLVCVCVFFCFRLCVLFISPSKLAGRLRAQI